MYVLRMFVSFTSWNILYVLSMPQSRDNTGCTDNNQYCGSWAEIGECDNNPGYMAVSCCASCSGNEAGCTDDNQNCGSWAEIGECDNNPEYMEVSCCASCSGNEAGVCPDNPTRNPSSVPPPFSGTLWNFPNTIKETDRTAFTGITYAGQQSREMFDGRYGGKFITVNAYLFTARFNDHSDVEFRCNPEYGRTDAFVQAEKYAKALGRIPEVFRSRVDIFDLNRGTGAEGGRGGGNQYRRSMSLNTGYGEEIQKQGLIEELFMHEGSHASLDGTHANARKWICAQNDDGKYISDYARGNPEREDVAESVVAWLVVRYRSSRNKQADIEKIKGTIPNRITYFDQNLSIQFPR